MAERKASKYERETGGMRGYLVWPIAFVAMVACATIATAWGGGRGLFAGSPGDCPPGAQGCERGFDSERTRDRVSFGLGWMLHRLDASDDQQQQIEAIAFAAIDDVMALHAGHEGDREALAALVSAPSIDRDAVEALRSAHLAIFDKASLRITAAAVDALEVLTEQQRTRLVEEARRHHH